jgi:hypothetical protein
MQRVFMAAESMLQRKVAFAVKQETKQLATQAGAFKVQKKVTKPVHLSGLELVTDAYGRGVYGCV